MYVLKRLRKAYDFTTGMEMEQLEHVLSRYYWFGNSVIHSTDLDLFSKGQNGSYGHITSKKTSGFHSVNQFTHKAPPLRVPSWPPFLPPSPPYHLTTHGGTSKAAVECLAQVQVGFSTVVHSPYHSLWTNLTAASMVKHNQGPYSQNVTRKLVRPQIFVTSPQMS